LGGVKIKWEKKRSKWTTPGYWGKKTKIPRGTEMGPNAREKEERVLASVSCLHREKRFER